MIKTRLMELAGIRKEGKLNEAIETQGFEKSKQSLSDIESMQKQINKLKRSLKSTFEAELSKYMTGRWDIIDAENAGAKRWQGQRKTMRNDVYNFYNAKIKQMKISNFSYDEKSGSISATVYVRAAGDNVEGEETIALKNLSIVPAYTSQEGKEYKNGY
jgi:hypothetical protein